MNALNNSIKTVKQYLTYADIQIKVVVGVVFSLIITTAMVYIRPVLIEQMVDSGITNKEFTTVIIICAMLIMFMVAESMITLFQVKTFASINVSFEKRLYTECLNRIMKTSHSNIKRYSTVELFSMISLDIRRAELLVDSSNISIIQAFLRFACGAIGILVLDWRLGIIVLLTVPCKYLLIKKLAARKSGLVTDYLDETKTFDDWYSDQIDGVIEIKLWNLYKHKLLELEKTYKKIPIVKKRIAMCDGYEIALMICSGALIEVIAYLLGGYMVCIGRMSIGTLLAYIAYSSYVTQSVEEITNVPYIWAQINPSLNRLNQILNMPSENLQGFVETDNSNLVMDNVSFGYGTELILKNCSLSIPYGEKIAVVGDNGSGKSTLVSILLGIIYPERGSVKLGSKTTDEIGLSAWRNKFAVVSQDAHLFRKTVAENICIDDLEFPGNIGDIRIENIPFKHDEAWFARIINDNEANISGGEKKKISFLRACCKSADILVFDEVFSNCDIETREAMRKYITETEKTVLLISHYQEDIEGMDHVYQLKDGHLEIIR